MNSASGNVISGNPASGSGPRRILLVTTELRPGGAEKCLVNLACGLNREHFEPRVASIASAPGEKEARLVRKLADHAIPVSFFDCDSKFRFPAAVGKLRALLAKESVDLVQSFLIHANVIAGRALARFPAVEFYSGIRVADPSWFRHRLERWATAGTRKIICVSRSVRQFASERMGLPEHKLVDIPNGVEPWKIDPVPDDSVPREWFSDDLPTVLFLGRLEPQKGLIPFFKALRDQANLPPFRLLLVGEGSQQTRLQSMARSLKQEVIFAGWAESPHRLIAKSKVVILPSLWEGMPNALLETMAVGRPFVAFGVDGVREIALPDTLQAVEAGDYRSFFERLSQVLGSQKLASDLGNQNRQHVETNFSIKKMIAKYEAVYLGDSSSPAC